MKSFIKDQLKLITLESMNTAIVIFVLFKIAFINNLFNVALDSIVFPATYMVSYLEKIISNSLAVTICAFILQHVIYCFYLYFCKRNKSVLNIAIIIYITWLILYLYLYLNSL